MNIYVGNLAWKTKRKELKELFENFGEVTNAFIVRDKKTRRSRGFGFVEMSEDEDALVAIEKLNNTVFLERTIIVNEARPKDEEYQDDDDVDSDYDEEPTEAAETGPSESKAEKPVDEWSESSDSGPDTPKETAGNSVDEDVVKNN
jgi:RNA recognition motif-containing protein